MGSRTRRYAPLAALSCGLAGCSVGAPPGFSQGDRWTIPLVGPLEDGLLVVPGYVEGKGPYLFALDPDQNVSSVDETIVKAARLRTGVGPHLLDETDTEQNTIYAEVMQWQLGTLTTSGSRSAVAVRDGTYDRDGRRIDGLIGRDVIADSLVFGFDRDQGLVTLATQKAFTPLGTALPYDKVYSTIQNVDVVPPPLRIVTAQVGAKRVPMHVALGRYASELRPRTSNAAGLAGTPPRAAVSFGSVASPAVPFTAYADHRWDDQVVEGDLGLSALERYSLIANWDRDTFYVRPRVDQPAATRIARWASLGSCAHTGCATVTLIDPLAGKPPTGAHPGLVVSVARDASTLQQPLEVVIAIASPGKPDLPWLVANLPAGADRAMTHVSADYLGATATVADASPFPRACPTDGACIDKLAAP